MFITWLFYSYQFHSGLLYAFTLWGILLAFWSIPVFWSKKDTTLNWNIYKRIPEIDPRLLVVLQLLEYCIISISIIEESVPSPNPPIKTPYFCLLKIKSKITYTLSISVKKKRLPPCILARCSASNVIDLWRIHGLVIKDWMGFCGADLKREVATQAHSCLIYNSGNEL